LLLEARQGQLRLQFPPAAQLAGLAACRTACWPACLPARLLWQIWTPLQTAYMPDTQLEATEQSTPPLGRIGQVLFSVGLLTSLPARCPPALRLLCTMCLLLPPAVRCPQIWSPLNPASRDQENLEGWLQKEPPLGRIGQVALSRRRLRRQSSHGPGLHACCLACL
jgi:hypothetical protein